MIKPHLHIELWVCKMCLQTMFAFGVQSRDDKYTFQIYKMVQCEPWVTNSVGNNALRNSYYILSIKETWPM